MIPVEASPAEIPSKFVEANGLRFHCKILGEGKPRLLLFLHGFPEFSYSWRRQLTAFEEDWCVVAPDLRGYGLSDKPAGVSEYAIGKLEDDVYALVKALGYERCTLVGHDWGGAIAWSAVDRRPELFDQLVILNMPHPRLLQEAFARNRRQLLRSWYIFFFQLPRLPEALISRRNYAFIRRAFLGMTTRRSEFPREVLDLYAENASRPGALTAMVNYYRAAVSRKNFARKWRRLELPVQVIWGERDLALGSELLEGTSRFVADLRIHRIPDASHWVQQDAPDEVNRVMREFLR